MMMMMMMRRFVKRVLNSPQRRCQSIKQVALEMSSERQRRERCGSKGSWQTVPDAWAGDMTYNVFGGTLNLAQSINSKRASVADE